jgi:hypothetical protein
VINVAPLTPSRRHVALRSLGLSFLLAVLTGLWSTGVVAPTAHAAAACPDSITWTTTQTYLRGMFCLSTGTDVFAFQTDGNLVWYVKGVARWNSGTADTGQTLALQGDGNVVVYGANGQPLYASSWNFSQAVFTTPDQYKYLIASVGWGYEHFISHQIDLGNVGTVTMTGTSALNRLHWQDLGSVAHCTVISAGGIASPAQSFAPGQLCLANDWGTVVFQPDGNFVEHVSGQARWNSGTWGRGVRLSFQSDGNMVIYSASGAPIWAVSWFMKGWEPRDVANGNGTIFVEVIPNHMIHYESTDVFHSQRQGCLL